jgi:hypothetical protein
MKTNNLLGWFIILFAFSLFAILMVKLTTEEKQGRLIKSFPKEVQIVPHLNCGWCQAVKDYSLNINNKHIGEK